jgi:tetratricopeptide (TPR) repeat protein
MATMRSLAAPVLLAACGLAGPGAALAQIPEKFTNLQVLPKTITKRELVATMRGFASDLGVRCTHCHVGPDNLQGMDFATDEKRSKRVAREMMRMAGHIAETVAKLPDREPDPRPAVTCYTCHRALRQPPRDLQLVLSETADMEGIGAALATYKRLRQEHYGRGRYDFSEYSLNALAQHCLERGRHDDARAALELNREQHPSSAAVEAAFGNLHLATGDKEKARGAFKRALERDPENRLAQWGLQQVDAPAKAP